MVLWSTDSIFSTLFTRGLWAINPTPTRELLVLHHHQSINPHPPTTKRWPKTSFSRHFIILLTANRHQINSLFTNFSHHFINAFNRLLSVQLAKCPPPPSLLQLCYLRVCDRITELEMWSRCCWLTQDIEHLYNQNGWVHSATLVAN